MPGSSREPLKGTICFVAVGTPALKNISRCQPVGIMWADFLNVSPRRFTHGFPGLNDRFNWFVLEFRGHFRVAAEEDYAFRLLSQDGSILWIDGALAVDNDGLHGPISKSTTVHLTAGRHSLRLLYLHGAGTDVALQLFVTPPDGAERLWSVEL